MDYVLHSHIPSPIAKNLIARSHAFLGASCLWSGRKIVVISPKNTTKRGVPAPVAMANKVPTTIITLSVVSAKLKSSEYVAGTASGFLGASIKDYLSVD